MTLACGVCVLVADTRPSGTLGRPYGVKKRDDSNGDQQGNRRPNQDFSHDGFATFLGVVALTSSSLRTVPSGWMTIAHASG